MKAQMDKMSKEVIALHEANAQLKLALKEAKNNVTGDTSIDKLMASDPDLANELKSVARL